MKIRKMQVPFTQIANAVLNDKRISWKAKGIFGYIYSKPDDWDFSTHRMKNDAKDGMDALVSGIKELEKIGYLTRTRLPNGKVEYKIDYEPDTGNPNEGKSPSGKTQAVSNKDIHTNKDSKTNNSAASASGKLKKGSKQPLSLMEFVVLMREGKSRHVKLIGEYADEIKPKFSTEGEWYVFMNRNLRIASEVAAFGDDQIGDAMRRIEEDRKTPQNPKGYITKWSLETVLKFILDSEK